MAVETRAPASRQTRHARLRSPERTHGLRAPQTAGTLHGGGQRRLEDGHTGRCARKEAMDATSDGGAERGKAGRRNETWETMEKPTTEGQTWVPTAT